MFSDAKPKPAPLEVMLRTISVERLARGNGRYMLKRVGGKDCNLLAVPGQGRVARLSN